MDGNRGVVSVLAGVKVYPRLADFVIDPNPPCIVRIIPHGLLRSMPPILLVKLE
jgi:hypothetical protein